MEKKKKNYTENSQATEREREHPHSRYSARPIQSIKIGFHMKTWPRGFLYREDATYFSSKWKTDVNRMGGGDTLD